eukprot:m.17791 g.17791  ORF g.17791 m.17791 type:complete len:135 (-) comp5547_c0_seq1:1176-1580(-)
MAANGNNERAFQPSEAREVYQSLRRQLEHDLHEELMLYDPKADLSNRTRESLEKEVRQLRGEVNLSIAQILSRQHQIRDLMRFGGVVVWLVPADMSQVCQGSSWCGGGGDSSGGSDGGNVVFCAAAHFRQGFLW